MMTLDSTTVRKRNNVNEIYTSRAQLPYFFQRINATGLVHEEMVWYPYTSTMAWYKLRRGKKPVSYFRYNYQGQCVTALGLPIKEDREQMIRKSFLNNNLTNI